MITSFTTTENGVINTIKMIQELKFYQCSICKKVHKVEQAAMQCFKKCRDENQKNRWAGQS